MKRVAQIMVGVTVAALALSPVPVGAWGALSSRMTFTEEERKKLTVDLPPYASNRPVYESEFNERAGPHPIHQFIALKAFQLLERDPAFKDGESGFPDIKAINAWDVTVRTGMGMAKRPGLSPGLSEFLAPPIGDAGPAADAESDAGGKWNPYYSGAAHYYSPWLDLGLAPSAAATSYVELRKAIAEGRSGGGDSSTET